MKPKKPAPIIGHQRDKLIIALQLDDIVSAINTALRVRKITLTLDYTHKDRMPRLLMSMPDVAPRGWMIANARTHVCHRVTPSHPDLAAAANDIIDRLDKLNATIVLLAEKPANKKRTCKLQVQVAGARRIVLTLVDASDGEIKHDTSFQTPDGRTP